MKISTAFASLAVVLCSIGSVQAWFRVPCTAPLVTERVDPIISPNQIAPSNHVHTIHGASNFASNSTYNTLRASKCTNCQVAQDLTNYWFPRLYFHDPKTKQFEPVPNGGLLVYYQNRGNLAARNGGAGLKAFPAGFRMLTGNAVRRGPRKYAASDKSQPALAERAPHWQCLRYTTSNPGYDSDDRNGAGFPTTDCEAGFNARLHFPACWDGKTLEASDHTSHVAYLDGMDNGVCPSTHPVGLMKILFEVTWDVHSFAGRWSESDGWPFVYATGDPTGYSWHGDFQNGWNVTALQNAINQCDNPNDDTGNGITEACKFLTVTKANTANRCKIAPVIKETIDGQLAKLPGCNPLQAGPQDATIYSDSNCPKN